MLRGSAKRSMLIQFWLPHVSFITEPVSVDEELDNDWTDTNHNLLILIFRCVIKKVWETSSSYTRVANGMAGTYWEGLLFHLSLASAYSVDYKATTHADSQHTVDSR